MNIFTKIILYGIIPLQVIVVPLVYCNIQAMKSYILARKGINIITTAKKSLKRATLNHAARNATLQNNELIVEQETIQPAQIKKCFYNTDNY